MSKQEIIDIIKAYKNGDPIEMRWAYSLSWEDCKELPTNFDNYEYRVKNQFAKEYTCYQNADEVLQAIREHGPMFSDCGSFVSILQVRHDGIYYNDPCGGKSFMTFSAMLCCGGGHRWQDGTYCGNKR